jgi:hypothetical protein
MPGSAPSYTVSTYGNTAYARPIGGTAPMNIDLSCETTFEVRNDRVVSWSWKGNNCKARG